MNDFEKKIYDRIPEVSEEALLRRINDENAKAEAAEIEDAARERFARTVAISRQLGESALDILLREEVQDVPIIVTRTSGYTHEVARGWHIITYPGQPGIFPTAPEHFGLNRRADLLSFSASSMTNKGQRWSGIIGPKIIKDGLEKIKILEGDKFRDGMASLIAGHGPHTY